MGAITTVPRKWFHSWITVLVSPCCVGVVSCPGCSATGEKGEGDAGVPPPSLLRLLSFGQLEQGRIWTVGVLLSFYAAWIKDCIPMLVRWWSESDKECCPLLEEFDQMPQTPGLSCREQNLLLCETTRAAKSCPPLTPPPLFFPAVMSHTALAAPGASLVVAQEPLTLTCSPVLPRGKRLRRLLLPFLLRRIAATPQFLQAFLSGHHWLTHNWYRHQTQAISPLLSKLCGSCRLFQCWKDCALCLV